MEVTEQALGVGRPLSSLWALVFVPGKEAGLEQYLQVGQVPAERREATKSRVMGDTRNVTLPLTGCYVLG